MKGFSLNFHTIVVSHNGKKTPSDESEGENIIIFLSA